MVKTGEVGRAFGVHQRVVAKWIDSGKLAGYRIPLSLVRVVSISEVLRFARAHGLPMNRVPPHWYASDPVAVVGNPGIDLPDCVRYPTYMDYMFHGKPAGVMVIDTTEGVADGLRLVSHIAAKCSQATFVVIVPEDFDDAAAAVLAGIRYVVRRRPVDPVAVARDVMTFREISR